MSLNLLITNVKHLTSVNPLISTHSCMTILNDIGMLATVKVTKLSQTLLEAEGFILMNTNKKVELSRQRHVVTCKRAGLSLLTHSNNTCKQNSWKSMSDLQTNLITIITNSRKVFPRHLKFSSIDFCLHMLMLILRCDFYFTRKHEHKHVQAVIYRGKEYRK